MCSCGFTLSTSSSGLNGAYRDLCPRFLRQLHGLKRIDLFRWRGSGLPTPSCISYPWLTGTECSKSGCTVRAQADTLLMGACLFQHFYQTDGTCRLLDGWRMGKLQTSCVPPVAHIFPAPAVPAMDQARQRIDLPLCHRLIFRKINYGGTTHPREICTRQSCSSVQIEHCGKTK
jgi:hypothetical protein